MKQPYGANDSSFGTVARSSAERPTFTNQLFRDHDLPLRTYAGEAASVRVVDDWAHLGVGAGLPPRSKISAERSSSRPLVSTTGFRFTSRTRRCGTAAGHSAPTSRSSSTPCPTRCPGAIERERPDVE